MDLTHKMTHLSFELAQLHKHQILFLDSVWNSYHLCFQNIVIYSFIRFFLFFFLRNWYIYIVVYAFLWAYLNILFGPGLMLYSYQKWRWNMNSNPEEMLISYVTWVMLMDVLPLEKLLINYIMKVLTQILRKI